MIPLPDGTLTLRQNGKTELTAIRESDARATAIGSPTDPSRHTTVADASETFRFSFPDLNGRLVANTDRAIRRQGRAPEHQRQLVPKLP